VEQDDSGYFNMRDVSRIVPEWLVELAPHLYRDEKDKESDDDE